MKKRLLATVTVVFALLLVLTSCSKASDLIDSASSAVNSGLDNATSALDNFLSGDTIGEVGKTYSTQWFSFNVKSITAVDEYAGYTAADGMQLIDVVVQEKNIFDQTIPMGTADFFTDEATWPDYIYPMDPLDDTMMPIEFDLAVGETVEYHLIYEVPEGFNSMMLVYVEYDITETEGATFTINFTI